MGRQGVGVEGHFPCRVWAEVHSLPPGSELNSADFSQAEELETKLVQPVAYGPHVAQGGFAYNPT